MTQWKSIVSALCLVGGVPSVGADDIQKSAWKVDEGVTALTGAKSISAVLESSAPLVNMIGQPQNAALVLRCQDGVLAAYVSWVEVLSVSGTTFGGRPQSMLLWRVDQQPIKASFWLRDDAGIATGHFETKPASKWIGTLLGARQLVVRIAASRTQDAVFDLSGMAPVAARVGAACGVTWGSGK